MAVIPVLEVKNASFRYGEAVIFEDISFILERGDILCLLGPNGCGKTTLLDTVLGFHALHDGTVLVEGKDIRSFGRAELARKMAYVPQIHEKSFPYRVIDIVVMGRTPHLAAMSPPSARDYEIARAAIDSIGISCLAERIYTTLSGGETQLVILARALAQDAPVILMDEPASHLDFRHEHLMLRLVAKLVMEKGLSVIMSTHSPNHAFYLENTGVRVRTALMGERRIIAVGSPAQTITGKNIRRLYDVDSRVFSNTVRGAKLNYIIPLNGVPQGKKK